MTSEWVDWHRGYEKGGSLAVRLAIVQGWLRRELDARPPGEIRLISLCSGDGRDVIGALRSHPRREDVLARLVDLDPAIVTAGRQAASDAGLDRVQFVRADAGWAREYEGSVPADILLACGIFGNVSDEDVEGTIAHLPELSAPGALVLWTRGRFEPDLTPTVRSWFAASGFEEVEFIAVPGSTLSVGAHRLTGTPRSYDRTARLFRFLPPGKRPRDRARPPPAPAPASTGED